jgi:hypothetical protein
MTLKNAIKEEKTFRDKIEKSTQFAQAVILLVKCYKRNKFVFSKELVHAGISKEKTRVYAIMDRFILEGLAKKGTHGWSVKKEILDYESIAKKTVKESEEE